MNENNGAASNQNICSSNILKTTFISQNDSSVKITLEFSAVEQNAHKEFVNILKNLYIEKLKKEIQNAEIKSMISACNTSKER